MREYGPHYTKSETTWRCWAPTQEKLTLRIFDELYGETYEDYEMKREGEDHVITLSGDFDDISYVYVTAKDVAIQDPYAKASTLNSERSVVIDLASTDPKGWERDERPDIDVKDAIIYEAHVKDMTYDETSGVRHRGKYLGLAESGTTYKRFSTGLDHLSKLGITHLHLMPIQDFYTVDESEDKFHDEENYNWGYDPIHYFVPEGSYATEPAQPKNRITELKTMIMALHKKGIKVVLDVVYNHTYKTEESPLELLVPGYYYRMKNKKYCDGSGCGNEIATEKPMVKHMISESLRYWQEEFHVDGFRFDLWGLMDQETALELVEELRERDPQCLIYGEPWSAQPPSLPENLALEKGDQRGLNFAFFNDAFRNAILGELSPWDKGFVQSNEEMQDTVKWGIVGSPGPFKEPQESINYVNSHDDYIMEDKLQLSVRQPEKNHLAERTKLAFDLLFLSQGIPFFTAGNEFRRSKGRNRNTYNAPIDVNSLKWDEKIKEWHLVKYVKELITFRKYREVFTLTRKEVDQNVKFYQTNHPLRLHWSLDKDQYRYQIYVNATDSTWAPLTIREEVEQTRMRLWSGEGRDSTRYLGRHVEIEPYTTGVFEEKIPTEENSATK